MEKEVLLKKLGARIREIRSGKNISQLKLAHSIGKDQQSIQRLEAGNINPSYYYLYEIATGLDITVSELLAPLYNKG
ncbi:helix-turn-helix domain-containing protein [Mucilaginibacter sp. HMF5004]|uniref:helix-turn-helix domain-containing protein n=1 Tax=Mucilaginibacter rivuli TaxID=2857527 RepID=UPI001C5EE664|nr:helix-turn-helix transcriptional regulator [Mucilaginibacter rivuli]MBW4888466.1 helix-turn-helix domain-containing protein [Mucilaginibacter rivuli]